MPTNLSRRELLAAIGLAGTAVALNAGEAAADQLDPRPQYIDRSRLWWVKETNTPTTEIDWQTVKRFDETKTTRKSMPVYVGKEKADELNALNARVAREAEAEQRPGYTTKDIALKEATNSGRVAMSFLGPNKATTPKDRGVPIYEGTPEENTQIVTAALRHMGAATVGVVELDSNTEKLIYSVDPDGKAIVFEDVEVGSEDEKKRVLPKKARWVIVYTIQMSTETMRRSPTMLGSQTTTLTYTRQTQIQAQLQEFLRALGYHGYGEAATNALGIAPALGVMAGLGELSRLNRLVTPEYGPMVRVFKLVTDLPLAPTKPIDAGIMEFCKNCKKCAEACPSKSLSFDREPSWETKGGWNNPGHKAYFEDSTSCRAYWAAVGTNCGICFASCPYAKSDLASVHTLVKATASMTPAFDGMFRKLDDVFYEDYKDPEEWWKTNLPEMGIDTTQGHKK
jgi:epoxyqueuosine reductase